MQISDYIPFNISKCLYFIDLTHFKGQGRYPYNNFIGFLENLRHHNFVLRLSDLQHFLFYSSTSQTDDSRILEAFKKVFLIRIHYKLSSDENSGGQGIIEDFFSLILTNLITHYLRMNYYIQKIGGLDLNGIQLK